MRTTQVNRAADMRTTQVNLVDHGTLQVQIGPELPREEIERPRYLRVIERNGLRRLQKG